MRLAFGEFARAGLQAQAASLGVTPDAMVRQGARHYLAIRDSDRMSLRFPRFARDLRDEPADFAVALEEPEWAALEVDASHQRLPLERLLEHAVLLFLADVESGRVAVRIAEGEMPGNAKAPRGSRR